MKLCPRCKKTFLPYLMVLLVAGVASFMTWLTLSLSNVAPLPSAVVCLGIFLAVGATLLHYVISCIRRHCHHWGHQSVHSAPFT